MSPAGRLLLAGFAPSGIVFSGVMLWTGPEGGLWSLAGALDSLDA